MSAAGKPDDGGFSLVSEPAANAAAPAAANDDGGFTLVSEPKEPYDFGKRLREGVEEGVHNVISTGEDMLQAGADQARQIWEAPLDPGQAAPGPLHSLGTLGKGLEEAGDVAMRAMQSGFQVPAAMLRAEGQSLTDKIAPAAGFIPGAAGEVLGSIPEGFIGEGGIPHIPEERTAAPREEARAVSREAALVEGGEPVPLPAEPATEAVAGDIMAAGDVDQAIKTAQSAVTGPPLNVDAMAAEAQRQGAESAAPAGKALEPAEPIPAPALDDGGYQEVARPSGPAPLEPAYSDAKARAETYSRWLDDLDAKRRQEAAASPMANFLRQSEAVILGKVNGVEDRLTNAGAARLADVRGALDELLNPAADSTDMARVREAMVAEHQKMADAAAPPPILREVHAQAQAIGEPLSHDEAQQIVSEIGAHGVDPQTALAEHIERKAIRGLYSDDEGSAASPAPTEPVTGRPGETDLTTGNRVPGQEPVPVEEGGARPLGEPTPENSGQTRQLEPATFTTAKGSTYEVHEDGTTTRNKAARPEHPGEQGPQPRSEATFYVTPERADELGLIQTHGGQPMAIAERTDGTVGVKYTAGPGAGKFERRTVGPVSHEPAPGLIPVETWKDGTRVHFGNEITEVNTPKPKAGTMALRVDQEGARYGEALALEQAPAVEQPEIPRPRALALKGIEGTGEEKSRSVSPGQTYHVGEEAPQIEAAARLVEKDPAAAEEIAMRRKQPPPGVHPEFVFMALENKATREGNGDLVARLNQSRIAEEATTMGQRVAAYRNRDPLSAVAHVQAVQNARTAAAEAAHGDIGKAKAKALEEVTQEVQQAKKTAASTRPRQSWSDFIASITCTGE